MEVILEGVRMRLGMINLFYILEYFEVFIYYCFSIFRIDIMEKKVCVIIIFIMFIGDG